MKILAKEQILLLHEQMIEETGGAVGIRDEGLLDSAISAPFQSYDGNDVFPSLYQKAARLCYGIVKNHPFVDGNKRTGAHAMLVMLYLNGAGPDYSQKELSDIILSVAAGDSSYEDLLKWLIERS